MSEKICPKCGKRLPEEKLFCTYCGEVLKSIDEIEVTDLIVDDTDITDLVSDDTDIIENNIDSEKNEVVTVVEESTAETVAEDQLDLRIRNKKLAALLSVFLGVFGIHKFYLGKPIWGILYLASFFIIGAPLTVASGIIEGIIYFFMSDNYFQGIIVNQKKPLKNEIREELLIKSKNTAAVLAIFLGIFGVHKFYLGKFDMGIIYLLFSFTAIPLIIGIIEGIIYIRNDKFTFANKQNVGIK